MTGSLAAYLDGMELGVLESHNLVGGVRWQ